MLLYSGRNTRGFTKIIPTLSMKQTQGAQLKDFQQATQILSILW